MINRTSRCILIATALFASMFCQAQSSQKHLFVVAKCDGTLSSIIVSALKDAATASQKYHVISTLMSTVGHRDVVQTITLMCGESKDVTAIAMLFGIVKCKSTKLCLSTDDSFTLNVALCNANLSVDCGRTIFEGFDKYINRPDRTPLKVD